MILRMLGKFIAALLTQNWIKNKHFRLFNSWGSRNDIVHKILDVCLRISNRVCSTDEFVLRVTGDYTFGKREKRESFN